MKTLITASALILVSNIVLAHSYEEAFKSPDVSPKYGSPTWIADVQPSGTQVATSLEVWSRGNPDSYDGSEISVGLEDIRFDARSALGETSLDVFTQGNPDTYSGG